MSKYGTIPTAAASSTTPPPDQGSSPTALDPPTSCAACPRAFPFRSWRELLDPRALSVPAGGFADPGRRARANLARFAGNYHLAFLVVFSVSLLWRPRCLPSVFPCFLLLSTRFFPVIMALTLLQNMLTGAAKSVLVSLPVGILPVVLHAVLHDCPADCADDGEAGSIAVWRRGLAQGDESTTRPPPARQSMN